MKIQYAKSESNLCQSQEQVGLSSLLWDIVECPVCLRAPKHGAPIFQCRNGHIICRECYKMAECPVCRAVLCTNTKIRCRAAEKMIERLYETGSWNENIALARKQQRAFENVTHQVQLV